jgi:hypothetical protein
MSLQVASGRLQAQFAEASGYRIVMKHPPERWAGKRGLKGKTE